MPLATYPTLRSNEIYAALSNQVISQQTYADNISTHFSTLLDENRVDGTLFGDVKNYIATDVLKSVEWGADESTNLLELYRAQDPEVQSIYLDKFRQIILTTDEYLTKRAWGDEGAFSQFNSTLKTWMNETRRIYETTLFNSFLGTNESTIGKQNHALTLPKETDEPSRRMRAQDIAAFLANLFDDLEDVTRNYNDYENLRSFNPGDIIVVWNNKVLNSILKKDLPTIFHSEEVLNNVTRYKLPSRYFGIIKESGGSADGTTIRSLIEKDYNSVKMSDPLYDETKHVFPGDLIPSGEAYLADEAYVEDDTILFKVMYKRSIPFMTSMSVATDFFNQRSLTDTMYLTFGHNTLQHLKNYPMITVRESGK